MSTRAVLHVHSTYSDGEFTLRELREIFLRDSCRVVCMADHADAFTAEECQSYRAECERLSDARLRFVPGLEYTCERQLHVVGYGVTDLAGSDDPVAVIRHIRACGGVSVVAHPPDPLFEWIERFEVPPDGIEAWNTKYDGRYAPRPNTFALIKRIQQRQPGVLAFYGQDLHWRHQARVLFLELDGEPSITSDILSGLKQGRFVGVRNNDRLPSSGDIDPTLLARFGTVQARSRLLRRLISSIRLRTGVIGRHIPATIKAQLRRFF